MSIPQLINAGYSAIHILNVLSDNSPKSGGKIKKALALGYPASQILKYLTGGKEEDDSYMTLEEKTNRNLKRNERKGINQAIMSAATLAGGVYGLSKLGQGAQAIAQGVTSQLPNPSTPPLMPNVPTPAPVQPNAPNPLSAQGIQQQAAQLGTQQAAPIPTQATAGPPTPDIDFYQTSVYKNFPQIEKAITNYKDQGFTPEEAYDKIMKSPGNSPIAKKYESEAGQPFLGAINQIYNKPPEELIFPEAGAPPKESDVVMTPTGSGEIHKIKGNDAYVEEDNKLRKIPLDEIEHGTPEARKAIADYLQIKEKDRSGPIAMWFYDPEHKNLWVQWHFEGQVSKYRNVDEDIVSKIKAKAAIPVTTGENEFGSWSPADEESLGAAVDQFLKKDVRWKKAGKGEAKNPNYDTYDLGYDFWEKLRKKRIRPKKI